MDGTDGWNLETKFEKNRRTKLWLQ